MLTPIGDRIAERALSFCETPFRHQGREPGRFLDCAGAILCSYEAEGVAMADDLEYSLRPVPGLLSARLEASLGPPRADMQVGDALVFWIEDPAMDVHGGILVPGGLVHVELGGVVECVPLAGWRAQLVANFGLR